MALGNVTGTNIVEGRWSAGQTHVAVGKYTLGAAIAQNDTITWTNILPGGGVEILDVTFYGVELDTNASPTGTVDLGDGTDVDGFIDGASVGLAAAGATQVIAKANGTKLGTTYDTATSIVATFPTAFATAASSGDVFVVATYNCVGSV